MKFKSKIFPIFFVFRLLTFFFALSSFTFNISEAITTRKTGSRTNHHHEITSLTVSLKPIDALVYAAYNITPNTLFNLKLERDRKKIQNLSNMVAATRILDEPTTLTPESTDDYDFNITVTSGHLDKMLDSEYYTEMSIGTPPVKYMFTVDTGSDITWMQCLPCIKCFDQVNPTFNPNKSASYSVESCSDYTLCGESEGCNDHGECTYNITYADGSYSRGVMAIEIFKISQGGLAGEVSMLIPFGCGRNNSKFFADGLLGLGRGAMSFSSQVNRQFGFDKFSYCLADKLDSRTNISSLTFGFYVSDEPNKTIYTPLYGGPSSHYVINLVGITVAGKQLQIDTSTSLPYGVAVDSGTTLSRFPTVIYEALRDIVRVEALRLGWKPVLQRPSDSLDTCFSLSSKQIDDAPTVILHFESDANIDLHRHNVMIGREPYLPGEYCLAFLPTATKVAILGNAQQQGIRVVYDLSKSAVGFVPNSC